MLRHRTTPTLDRPDALVAAGQRYVAFALEHPAHFEVMFDTSLLDPGDEDLTRERVAAPVVRTSVEQLEPGVAAASR